jgi:hypothetical protein
MREELETLEQHLKPNSGVSWECQISFSIPRMPFAKTFGDYCLESGAGYSLKLKFWYYVEYLIEVVLCTLKHTPNNNDGRLISINVLEFLIVILDYFAALTHILLNIVDNTLARSWKTYTCKRSRLGRLLAKLF